MTVNFWAVLVSAIASMVIGSIWYGPLFGKKFMKAMEMDKMSAEKQAQMKKAMGMMYFAQFIASLVMFYVLARFIGGSGVLSVHIGLMTALWVWIGFVVPLKFGDSLWGGKMTLFWIGVSNMLVTLLVSGAIIGAWR